MRCIQFSAQLAVHAWHAIDMFLLVLQVQQGSSEARLALAEWHVMLGPHAALASSKMLATLLAELLVFLYFYFSTCHTCGVSCSIQEPVQL